METETLANLIDKKYDVLSLLRQLADAQSKIIQQGDISRLMKLLATKQNLLNQLQALERQLDPFRNQEPESRHWSSSQRRQQTRDAATRCETLLDEIMLVEKQCENDLVVRRNEASSRLQGIQQTMQATDAYLSNDVASSQQTSSHIDLSSET